MEKTNFTSYSSWTTKMMQRFAALAVTLCCLGLQVASAGHVYTPEGLQPDTPYDQNDPATYSVTQPNQTVLFADGITAILTAQGMNCGTMSYPFFDAGGVGAPFSDEGTAADMTQAFTVCPNSAMNQAISVTFQGELFLGASEMLVIYDGDDTNDQMIGMFGDAAMPGTISAGQSGMGDATGCLTFELTGLDGTSDQEGWRASFTMTEFANSVAVDAPATIQLAECDDPIPAVTLDPDYDCGTPGNPFFLQQVTVNGTAVPFLDGVSDVDGDGDVDNDDVVPATGTGVSAAGGDLTIPGTAPGPDGVLGTADDIAGALGVGNNEVCVVVGFDMNGNGMIDAGEQKAEGCDNVVVATDDPLVCNDNLNIGLDGDCVVTISPDVVLETPCDDEGNYDITLTLIQADPDFMDPQDLEGDGVPGYQGGNAQLGIGANGTNAVTAQIPGRYRYSIELGDNKCWGFLNLEDKRGPVCAPANDTEIRVIYDRDCDGDLTNTTGGPQLTIDPSGDDDLDAEYVLCTVLDAADAAGTTALRWDVDSRSFLEEGSGIYFDYLEAMDGFADYDRDGVPDAGEDLFAGDFFDCTGIASIFFREDVEEICELSQLTDLPIDETQYDVNRFEICTVASRTWFAIDKKGFQSAVGCTQYVFGLRPKASEIQLDPEATADCSSNIDDFCFQQGTAPYFFVNGGITNNGQGSAGPTTLRDVCAGSTATVSSAAKRYVLTPGEHTCKYAVSFHEDDQTIVIGTDADGNASCRKQTRYWSVIDWCDGSRVYDSFAQLIKVEDNNDPILVAPSGRRLAVVGGQVVMLNANGTVFAPYVIDLGTKLFDCEASGNLPAVTTIDNCSANEITRITIERTSPGTGEPGEDIFINNVLTDPRGDGTVTSPVDGFDLTLGTYVVEYFFEDDCGNATSLAIPAVFGDNRVPSAICNDELVVTLVPTGTAGDQRARLYGEDLDDTSRDNCWPVILEVRKGDGSNQPWGEFVEFNCTDVTSIEDDATLRVELRVTEDRNGNGRIDDGDLSNICWTYARIEDKTPPVISVQNGQFLCDNPELNGLQLSTGNYTPGADNTDPLFPTIVGGCSTEGITIQLLAVDARAYDPICKVGTFFREFRAVRTVHDNQISGNTLVQQIDVLFNADWTMQFPTDILVVCDDAADSNLDNVPNPLRIEDILINRGCDQWGMEVEDDVFDVIGQDGDGACFKIIRTYKFINWCTWDPTNTEEGVVIRPLDFFTNPALTVTLDYSSAPVLNLCNLQNDIDDRFERFSDPYDVKVGNDGDAVAEFDPAAGLYETDADWIYFDEEAFGAGSVNVFNGGDCIEADFNALTQDRVDVVANTPANALIDDTQLHTFVSAEAYGYFIYRQIIKVTDNEAPVIDPIDDFTVCDSTNVNGNCTVNVTFPVPTVDECKPTYRILWLLDANNDGTTDLTGELAGNGVDGFTPLTLNNIPYGTHGFRYVVEDGCGNNSFIDFDFSAMDCKAPTAYCVIGVNIELMPTGMVEVWASDVDAGSFDDCSEPVQLSFSPNPADSGLVFTCDQRGSNFVQLWVTDAAGNQSFCETIINVQSNDTNECQGGAAIAGGVATEMGDDVEGAEIRLSGASDVTLATEVDGAFGFENLVEGSDYTVTPEKDVNYLNGVSTFDLVLIRKHIIGTATLNSPYKMIAADVNNSQTITTLDMVTLRKLILNIDTELTNNTSWRFVDASYTFPNVENPWMEAFPEVVNFNDIQVADNAADFVAIKIGDVNNSATPNLLLGSDERTSNDAVVFNVADAAVVAGEEVTVDFTADMVDVAGYQFTLNFDNNVLDLVEIVEGAATAENFGTTLANEGTITTSFDGEVAADEVLFSLTFAAKASANLSELISVSSSVTAAEAYKANEVLDVALNFGGATQTAGFELFQNTPNPFNGVTTISFNLPTAATATLTVSDVTGKVLSVINGDYAKGLNQVQFSSNTATGVLYYTLETADFTATKKMIIVE